MTPHVTTTYVNLPGHWRGPGSTYWWTRALEEVAGPRLHIRPGTGFSLVEVEEPKFTGWQRLIKRVSEIVLTSVGLIVAAPVMVGIAAAVKLQDRGPVIFRQARVGRGGELFTMLKFRSMVRRRRGSQGRFAGIE